MVFVSRSALHVTARTSVNRQPIGPNEGRKMKNVVENCAELLTKQKNHSISALAFQSPPGIEQFLRL
jgi:hypothetical protein